MRQVDFQQHSQKNQRAISVSCPETNLQKRTSGESFFSIKSSIQFYFIHPTPSTGDGTPAYPTQVWAARGVCRRGSRLRHSSAVHGAPVHTACPAILREVGAGWESLRADPTVTRPHRNFRRISKMGRRIDQPLRGSAGNISGASSSALRYGHHQVAHESLLESNLSIKLPSSSRSLFACCCARWAGQVARPVCTQPPLPLPRDSGPIAPPASTRGIPSP
jgi:hypothetical protein